MPKPGPLMTLARAFALAIVPLVSLGAQQQAPSNPANLFSSGRVGAVIDTASLSPDSLTWCEAEAGDSVPCLSPDDPELWTGVIPEPATMTLLASGLAGMALADIRKRRKRKQD